MTLGILLLYVAIAAIILTLLVEYVFKKRTNWVMSYLQNFCGALFIFSGWVKAVDPLGTAYKMEQYFDQFESVFSATWFSFLAPLFPVLSTYSVGFSVFMIIFEIVLGVMLILGHKPKLTAWSFLLLVAFFTFLTGFTYLTGYVPGDVNFFDFGNWAAYDKNNMKVTDCGCFGDFIKLEPKVSFFKDIFLLIPSIYFLLKAKTMHVLFGKTFRNIVISLITLGLLYYCASNFMWDIPHKDFRPFKKGRDIAAQKKIEDDALANIQITAYNVENKATGEKKSIPYDEYLKTFQNYPSEEWNLEQEYTEPSVAHTKISEFDVMDKDGYTINDAILASEGPMIFLVAHKLYGDGSPSTKLVRDTIYKVDSVFQRDGSVKLLRSISRIDERTESYIDYNWKDYYAKRYRDVIIPFVNEAKAEGLPVVAAIGGADYDQIMDLKNDLNLDIEYGLADDILLKTIVRSNPGVVLMNKGILVDKWHFKKLPSFQEVKAAYLE